MILGFGTFRGAHRLDAGTLFCLFFLFVCLHRSCDKASTVTGRKKITEVQHHNRNPTAIVTHHNRHCWFHPAKHCRRHCAPNYCARKQHMEGMKQLNWCMERMGPGKVPDHLREWVHGRCQITRNFLTLLLTLFTFFPTCPERSGPVQKIKFMSMIS